MVSQLLTNGSIHHVPPTFTPPIVTSDNLPGILPPPASDLKDQPIEDLQKELALEKKNKTPYVPLFLRKSVHLGTRSNTFASDDRKTIPRHKSSNYDLKKIFHGFTAAAHRDQKINLHEFHGESNGDAYQDWLLQVEAVFDYKKYKDPKLV